jgi:hypothetical protein
MNAKAKGTRNEHRSKALLEAAGYAVTRAAGSLGAWDLVGIGPTDVVLLQVKTRDWPGTAEMEALQAFAVPPNCKRLVHRWRDRQRAPDVRQLGQAGAVLLPLAVLLASFFLLGFFVSPCRAALHGPIMGVRLGMVLGARPTVDPFSLASFGAFRRDIRQCSCLSPAMW